MADVISFTASATLAGGIGAEIDLLVDGKVIGSTIVGQGLESYSFDTLLVPGVGHDIQIQYVNDRVISGQDRNLHLQSIGINGQAVSANSSYEVYHAEAGGRGDFASSGNMYWNGTAEFSLPPSFFPKAAAIPGFYVSATGSDSGDGTALHPFATLAKAVSAMEQSSVKTTFVESGTYFLGSTVSLNAKDSGVTIQAAPGAKAILDGKTSLSTLIQLKGASSVTLQGLAFENTGGQAAALVLNGATNSHVVGNLFSKTYEGILLQGSGANLISGNEIDNSATTGIELDNQSNGNTLDSNLISGTGALGTKGGAIFLHGANGNVISHNQVENTAGIGIGIENWDTSTINVGNEVSDNILKNTDSSSLSTDSGAIYILGRSNVDTKTIVNENYISGSDVPSDSHIIGIYLDDLTSGVTVTNNIVADTISDSLQIHGGSNITVQNNIFDLGSRSGYAWGKAAAILFHAVTGVPMINDIITKNIITSTSGNPLSYCNIGDASATIDDNFYMDLINSHFHRNGDPLSESNPHWGTADFVNEIAGNYALGSHSEVYKVGFAAIDQNAMGLHPATPYWYRNI